MLGLFRTSRSSIGRGWLSVYPEDSVKSLPQRKDVNIFMAILWKQETWKEVSRATIKIVLRSVGLSKMAI